MEDNFVLAFSKNSLMNKLVDDFVNCGSTFSKNSFMSMSDDEIESYISTKVYFNEVMVF